MSLFLVNVLLSLAWIAVTGSFTLLNLVFGFLLGLAVLWLIRAEIGAASGYFSRARRVVSLGLLFFYELVLSAWRVAIMVMRPRLDIAPGILAYPLRVDRDAEITLLANLITLTPGTLSVDVSEDRSTLYVHAIDCSDPDRTRREIADGFERKILEAFR